MSTQTATRVGHLSLPERRYAKHPEAEPLTLPVAFVAPGWAVHRVILWDDDLQRSVRGHGWTASRVESGLRLPVTFRTPVSAKAAALAFNAAFPDVRVRPSGRRMKAVQKWWTAHRDEFDILDVDA